MPLLSTFLGHSNPENTFWYLSAVPELLFLASERLERAERTPIMTALAPTLEAYFTERLVHQRQASPNTVAAYRDAWRLLLGFAQQRTGKQPCQLDIWPTSTRRSSPPSSTHLEIERHNSRAHPQRPPRRHPLVLPLRRPAPPRARRAHRPSARHPHQTLRPGRSSPTSPSPKPTPCWPAPTASAGPADETTPSSSSPSRPGCASRSSPGCATRTSSYATGAHLRCWGKGRKERCTPLRPANRVACCAPG